MILFLDNQNKIYAANDNLKKNDVSLFKNAVWYDGNFSFFDGEEKEGYIKIHKWDGEKPVVEYKPELNPYKTTQLDRIEELAKAKNADIAQSAIDSYTIELIEGGLL